MREIIHSPSFVPRSGGQSIERTALLLRLIGRYGAQGARLVDLTEMSGLHRATAHRILRCLAQEKFVHQDAVTKRYCIGSGIYELGLAAQRPSGMLEEYRPVIETLAQATRDTAYLVMRSGTEAVCLHCVEGAFPIRTRTFEIGARRPLGVGAAGTSLLAALPDTDVQAALVAHRRALVNYGGLTAERVLARVAETRRNGYAWSKGTIVPGVSGLALQVPDTRAAGALAVSVAAIDARIPRSRFDELLRELRTAMRQLRQIHAEKQRSER